MILALIQVIILDIILSGDNAVVIAMAAMALPKTQRTLAILFGMMGAVIARVIFSAAAILLLHIPGLQIIGGAALLWVCWNMFKEIRGNGGAGDAPTAHGALWRAVIAITIADLSMSIDNILAIAAVARDHIYVMIIGLVLSITFMGMAANMITKIMDRWPVLKYVGLALIFYVACDMLWRGIQL